MHALLVVQPLLFSMQLSIRLGQNNAIKIQRSVEGSDIPAFVKDPPQQYGLSSFCRI